MNRGLPNFFVHLINIMGSAKYFSNFMYFIISKKKVPYFSIGSFSFSSKFLITSFFFKLNELKVFLLFFNTFLVTKGFVTLNFKLLSLKTRVISAEFFSAIFYFQPIISTLGFFWIKNLKFKDKIVIKNYEINFIISSIVTPDFFQIKTATTYLYIYGIKKILRRNSFSKIFIQRLICRIRKFNNKLDVSDILFLSLWNCSFIKEMLKNLNITPHSFCEIINLKRKTNGILKKLDFLQFFCLKKMLKKKCGAYFSLKYTFCFIILKFFQNLFKKHTLFFLNFSNEGNFIQAIKKHNRISQFLHLNKIILKKHTELLNVALDKHFYKKKHLYLFYPVFKLKKNYNSIQLKHSVNFQNFFLRENLYLKNLSIKIASFLNNPDSMQCKLIESLSKISFEKISGFLTHKTIGEQVKKFILVFNRIFFYHVKKINISKINLKPFFRLSCFKNIYNKRDYLQIEQYISGILYNFKDRKECNFHQKKTKSLGYQLISYLENTDKFFIKFCKILIVCFYTKHSLKSKWVFGFILKNKENFFILSRLYAFPEIITNLSSVFLNFFLNLKFLNPTRNQINEKYTEHFEKNSLICSLSRGFLNFLKKRKYLFLLKNKIKIILIYKDFFMGIFWTNVTDFKCQTAKHFKFFVKIYGNKKQLLDYLYNKYLKNIASFSSSYKFRKKVGDYSVVKNLKTLKTLIQTFPTYLHSKVFSNEDTFKSSNASFFGKTKHFVINIG